MESSSLTNDGVQQHQHQHQFQKTDLENRSKNGPALSLDVRDHETDPETLEILKDHLNINLLNFQISDGDNDCGIQFFQHAGSIGIGRQGQGHHQADPYSGTVDDQRAKHNELEMRKSVINVNLSQAFSNTGNFFAPFSFPDNGMDFDEPQFFPGNCVGYLETILEETDEEIDDEEGCSGINWWMANSDTDTDSVICLEHANQLNSTVSNNFNSAQLSKVPNEFLPRMDGDTRDRIDRIYNNVHAQPPSNPHLFEMDSDSICTSEKMDFVASSGSESMLKDTQAPSAASGQSSRHNSSEHEDSLELFDSIFYPGDMCAMSDEIPVDFTVHLKDNKNCSFEENGHGGGLNPSGISNEEFYYTSSDNDSEDNSEETSSDDSKTDGVVLAEFSLNSSFPVGSRFRSSLSDKSKSALRSFRSFDSLNSLTGYDIIIPPKATNSCFADSAFLRHSTIDDSGEENLRHQDENRDSFPEFGPSHKGATQDLSKQMSSEDLSEDSGIGFDGNKGSAFLKSNNLHTITSSEHHTVNYSGSVAEFALNPFVFSSASASEESSMNSSLFYANSNTNDNIRFQDEHTSSESHKMMDFNSNNPFFSDGGEILNESCANGSPNPNPNNPFLSNLTEYETSVFTSNCSRSQEASSYDLCDTECTDNMDATGSESPVDSDANIFVNHSVDLDGAAFTPDSDTREEKSEQSEGSSDSETGAENGLLVVSQRKFSERAKSLTNLSSLTGLRLSTASSHPEDPEVESNLHEKQSFHESELVNDTDERARSLEFLLDQESSSVHPENNLRLNSLPAVSEHELRIQRSLRKLNVPEWFTKHSLSTSTMSESFRNRVVSPLGKRTDVQTKYESGRDWKNFSASKTPSLSSLQGSSRLKHRTLTSYVPFNHDVTSPTGSNDPTSPSKSPDQTSRPTYVKKPYLGWRSQEKLDSLLPSSFVRSGSTSSSSSLRMSVYRPPAERLAAEALASGAGASEHRVSSEIPKLQNPDITAATTKATVQLTTRPSQEANHPPHLHRKKDEVEIRKSINNRNKKAEAEEVVTPSMEPFESKRVVPPKRYQIWFESSFLG